VYSAQFSGQNRSLSPANRFFRVWYWLLEPGKTLLNAVIDLRRRKLQAHPGAGRVEKRRDRVTAERVQPAAAVLKDLEKGLPGEGVLEVIVEQVGRVVRGRPGNRSGAAVSSTLAYTLRRPPPPPPGRS
jgi:hypothetical protein